MHHSISGENTNPTATKSPSFFYQIKHKYFVRIQQTFYRVWIHIQ